MLRLGLIGVGHGGTLLQANFPEHDNLQMQVTAVCDVDEGRLSVVAAKYGVARTTTDYKELVQGDDVDVVGVYSPGPIHAGQILAALDAGKHVMVTKSMVYSMEEAEQVLEAVDRSGPVLLVTQTMRGSPRNMIICSGVLRGASGVGRHYEPRQRDVVIGSVTESARMCGAGNAERRKPSGAKCWISRWSGCSRRFNCVLTGRC